MRGAICRSCGADTVIVKAHDGSEVELDLAARVFHQEVNPDADDRADRVFWVLEANGGARVEHVSVCAGRRR